MRKWITGMLGVAAFALTIGGAENVAYAKTVTLEGGIVFDSDFYAAAYPDVQAAFGTDFNLLLNHYNQYGKKEGRFPSAVPQTQTPVQAQAATATVVLEDGQIFDAAFYATAYPDVKAAFGTDAGALLNHYKKYGKKEGRLPSAATGAAQAQAQAAAAQAAAAQAAQAAAAQAAQAQAQAQAAQSSAGLVSIDKLQNLKSLKKKCTDAEFQAAYNVAAQIVQPLVGKSKQDQVISIAKAIRARVDSGAVKYTTSVPHYNDPYGYFVVGVGSCAGDTRATGMCLNMLGIPYTHVNENKWNHQWCRVQMDDGSYWAVDPYGLYVGPEG